MEIKTTREITRQNINVKNPSDYEIDTNFANKKWVAFEHIESLLYSRKYGDTAEERLYNFERRTQKVKDDNMRKMRN